jgi:hypothetical protein
MDMLKRSLVAGLAAFALSPFAVFSAQKFPHYPVQHVGDCAVVARQDGVAIGVQPVDSVQDQMTYFHVALSPRGFLPIFVIIHNQSKDDSLLLDKSAISYGTDNGPVENTAGQKAGVTITSAIPFVGPFIAMGLAESESQIKQNLILRELQSDTLAPGETMRGFLYVAVPKKGPRQKLRMQFPIAWSASGRTSTLNLTF